ncbi:MAG TPA: metalloregulator ArsR/SmtB family transcription factor [Chthonomonadales bacterium]|nr:metalloregulator ArsR/SmtB family transcription factor [Chthonomonadales bacterium]
MPQASAVAPRAVHPERIIAVREALSQPKVVERLAELFSALADPTRVRIVEALSASELCVTDLSTALGLSASCTSHQLRLLRALRLVRHRREGKLVYYALDDAHIVGLFREGLEHIREEAP